MMGTGIDRTHGAIVARARLARWLALVGLVLALMPIWTPGAAAADQATINITSLADDGTPLPFARFQVVDGAGQVLATRETTPPDGTVSITIDLTDPEMTYTVTMETPPACGIKPDDQVVGPFASGDSVDLTFETSFENGCQLGSISLYAYTCPSGLDLTIDDYAQYRDNCLEPQNGESFTVAEAGGGQSFSLTTGEYGIDGRAPIVGLVPGDYTVRHDGADTATTLVYCLTFDGTPNEAPGASETDREALNDDGAIELTLKNRNRIACDFFTVSEPLPGSDSGDSDEGSDDGDEPAEDEVVDEPSGEGEVSEGEELAPAGVAGSIEFHVATCPAGYDGSDYFGDCAANGTDDVTFQVVGQNTGHTDTATSNVPVSPGFGIAVIDGLPADTYTMSEDVPGDFVSVWVYCADSPGGGPRIPTPENGVQEFDIELADGQAVICDWFITPVQQFVPAIVRLTKFTCAAGYDGTTFDDFTNDCTDVTPGVTFNLSNGSGFNLDKTTNSDGKVRWIDLAPGSDYLLFEDVPGDALDNRVAFCNVNDGEFVEYNANDDGAADLDPIAEGNEVQCYWYNVPAQQATGAGSLEIHKSECPPGTTSNFFAVCHDNPVSEVGFEIDGPGDYNDLGNTDAEGHLTFSEMPAGEYLVSEVAPPANAAIYVVHCTRDGEEFAREYDDSTGMRIRFTLPEDANVICDWYNIPRAQPTATPAPTGGSITVIKRLCTDPVDEIENFQEECEFYGSGAEFRLTSVSTGNAKTGATGSNSQLVFSGLANGAYALKETSGDWCRAQADHVDASGNVLVQNGGNTNVYIYNCGKKNVTTLPGTGTGDGGSTWQISWWLAALATALLLTGGLAAKPALARRRA
jgi:hypothetical protein